MTKLFFKGFCGSPLSPPSRCPIPWFQAGAEQNFYYDSQVGNCLPYSNGCSSVPRNYDTSIYPSYDGCMSTCGYQQTNEQVQEPQQWDQYYPPVQNPDIWELNQFNFDQALRLGVNLLVDFYKPSCRACVIFDPHYKKAAAEALRRGLDVTFAKIDLTQNPILQQRFNIQTFPRLLLFPKNGARPKRYFKQYGLEANNFLNWLTFQVQSGAGYSYSQCSLDQFACYDGRGCIAENQVNKFTQPLYAFFGPKSV